MTYHHGFQRTSIIGCIYMYKCCWNYLGLTINRYHVKQFCQASGLETPCLFELQPTHRLYHAALSPQYLLQKVNEYDQEISQSHKADQPTAP